MLVLFLISLIQIEVIYSVILVCACPKSTKFYFLADRVVEFISTIVISLLDSCSDYI